MLQLVLKGRKGQFEAKATYDVAKKEFIVLKGSTVSSRVSESEKFRGSESVKKMREAYVKNGKVTKDVCFSSASTAANFITGSSTNGMLAWKDENGTYLKELLK